ncbi:LytR/AlgR family response regulator transcription factor [Xanthocytophaga flava]|uniref:LytR/AlgR family response regulator transcription factor n=1 Tax=Xanthocytophaga flava TaxID=3048013 RepID=UPI0028D86667|nr:LytTR family DNA-binding domain-containing protein [Xanthocytophaga flavus]MDJ1470790.1 LytTR family DNA-binding domain-containing protein [Xanthocytophaga flavus]
MHTTYTCIIVDDNEVDRLTAVAFVRKYPFLKIIGVCTSADEALSLAHSQLPDVLLLDIDMPGLSGLELRKQLYEIPACIFITAFPDYAVESFEKQALDFLVKPLRTERFAQTMERLEYYLTIRKKACLLDNALGADTIFIKDGYKQVKINLHEIVYLEALKDYTNLVTQNRKYCVLSSLSALLKEKNFQSFLRIHRSYAVQQHYISKVTSSIVEINQIQLPIGRRYKDSLTHLYK